LSQKIRIFCLSLTPWRFGVIAVCAFVFALTAGGAWLPLAHAGSPPVHILFSAQAVSFLLLLGATSFLYAGVKTWRPSWKSNVIIFNVVILGVFTSNQILPLLLSGS
jgi:hypothetical protein